jgi:hypothetical protein
LCTADGVGAARARRPGPLFYPSLSSFKFQVRGRCSEGEEAGATFLPFHQLLQVSGEGWCQCCGIFSIPDPGSESFHPGSEFFHPGSRLQIKEFKFFTPNNCFKALGNMIRVFLYRIRILIFYPSRGSRIRMLTFYPSRIQGSKRHRIPDPDPQHWLAQLWGDTSLEDEDDN